MIAQAAMNCLVVCEGVTGKSAAAWSIHVPETSPPCSVVCFGRL
jgi:hypothetical protein